MFINAIVSVSSITDLSNDSKTEYKNLIGSKGYIVELDEGFNLLIYSVENDNGLIILPKVISYSIEGNLIIIKTLESRIILDKEN